MSLSRGFSLRELFKTMGMKSVLVSMLMFLLTVAVTCVVGFQFYRTTKDNIHLQGRVNAVQSAKELDGYILVRKNAEYEKISDQLVATEELLEHWIFDLRKAEVIFPCIDGKEVGFALFFHNFSTLFIS